jgi:hypothetical protein
MAQSGYTPILLYYSTAAAANPSASNLASGELAINITDGKLYYKDNSSAVQVIGWKTTPTTAGGTGLTTYATGDLIYASATNTLSKLAAGTNGQVLTLAGGVPTWAANTGGVTSFQTSLSGLTPSTSSTGAITLAGTLGLGSGGTGFTTYATGDLIYASATNTLSKLAAGTNGYVLTLAAGVPSWAVATSGATGGGSDQVFFVNGQTVTTNYTIPSGKNAMSGGPITVSSGIVVTVPSGSKWTVVG